MDVLDLWGGGLTLRRLAALIRHLPEDSALAIASNGGEKPWSLLELLVSDVWAVEAKRTFRKPPDAHPWRADRDKKIDNRRQQSRAAKLARAQQRNRRRVAGR